MADAGDSLDDLNREVLDAVKQCNRVHRAATALEGRFTIRICVLSFRTHEAHLRECLVDIERAIADVLE